MEEPTFNSYIDGYNLYYGALEDNPNYKWLDLLSLSKALVPNGKLGKVYYFTARVKERFPGDGAGRRQHAYLRALEATGVEIVLGDFRKDERWLRVAANPTDSFLSPEPTRMLGLTKLALKRSFKVAHPDHPRAFVYKMTEKGSDVKLASYLLRDCFASGMKDSLVITGDSDLVTPILFSVNAGMNVRVVVPSQVQYADSLERVSTSFSRLNPELLAANQLPKSVIRGKGSTITRPNTWA
ncbi:MAG: NYN domain-containing protein [Micrococcales bacterium]|nr:NYN domain-containing protein [Microbacteriaceae bacterium]NBR24233.1 NYN domain-containing protein [Micrococcales bacterium]NBR77544.1 NYN domain-containing protein [Microbacteriaceae bacterium]